VLGAAQIDHGFDSHFGEVLKAFGGWLRAAEDAIADLMKVGETTGVGGCKRRYREQQGRPVERGSVVR
jgi:hypothetical protein